MAITKSETGGIVGQFNLKPDSFNKGQFNTDGHMYPNDLMDPNLYGGNYVIFYISVHADSKLVAKGGSGAFVPPNTLPNRIRSNGAGDLNSAAVKTAVGAAAVGTSLTSGVTSALAGKAGLDLTSKGKAVVDALGGTAFATTALATVGEVNRPMKTMKTAIALHMPSDLVTKYGAQYGEEDMAGMMAAATLGDQLGAALKEAFTAGEGWGGDKALNAGSAVTSYLTAKALNAPGGVGGILSKTAGVAANPKKEQIFRDVDFRSFSFSYQFWPRSAEESANVMNIIRQFKYHMHPEYKDAGHFLWVYPSEFDIKYYTNGSENLNIHRHTSCVLTDMSVSYTPQGVYTSFEDGMPTQINLTLTFKELAQLSKETIAEGY
jgi:hypothetical protein